MDAHGAFEAPEERIDGYRLLAVLGRGGMSTVYLAERADGEFRHEVAIKVLKAGLDSDELIRRFRLERQILANLDHPAIARLIDGGRTRAGRPYLVLERVEGERIDAFCRRLPALEARLRLFIKVCRAVHCAHQNLVVHRDLKPSNILVQRTGEPKLLDFGIAKLLAPSAEGTLTAAGLAGLTPMTPEYASPEQVLGLSITTASDVYSLGALLYELLTLRSAHRLGCRSRAEIERAVCEEVPLRPSLAARPEDGRALLGDLDTIVLKALAKEPERRYASAEDLARDLERFLAGQPVAAHPDSALYRAGKFIRRHKTGFASAAAALVLLELLTALVAVQRNRVEQSEARARAVVTFLFGLFEGTAPGSGKSEPVVAREMLDLGAREVETSFSQEPELKADLSKTLARLYRAQGLLEPAKALLDRAEELERGLYGPAHANLATTLRLKAELRRMEGAYPEAEALARSALAMHESVGGVGPLERASDLTELARVFTAQHRDGEAEAALREALALTAGSGAAPPEVSAGLKLQLASLARNRGDLGSAEKLELEALAMARALHPGAHPLTAAALGERARTIAASGRPAEAEALVREALAMKLELYGGDHLSLSQSETQLAHLRQMQGANGEAEALYRKALAGFLRQIGSDSPGATTVLENLAMMLQERGDLAQAEGLFRDTLAALERRGAGESIEAAVCHHNLGGLLIGQQRFAEGVEASQRAVELRRALRPLAPHELAVALANHGTALAGLGNFAAAVTAHQEALDLGRKTNHPELGAELSIFGRLKEQMGDREGARELYREAVTVFEAKLGPDHPRTTRARARLAALEGPEG